MWLILLPQNEATYRLQFYEARLFYKLVLVSTAMQICFKENQRLGLRVVLPELRKKATTSVKSNYDQSSVERAAKLRNILPIHVNTVDALPAFKTALGNFLDTIPDNPPISGYYIADWFHGSGNYLGVASEYIFNWVYKFLLTRRGKNKTYYNELVR